MKKITILLAVMSLFCGVQGALAHTKEGDKQIRSCEEQLVAYLTRPEVLKEKNLGGIVVIQFQVNADSQMDQLRVFSADERLNASLIRQLLGKKLNLTNNEYRKTYTVRLHFQVDKS
ncbi:hypothetical protein GCM10023187_42570 [Nibrella viscosa]|uniref:TonB C-terminal domain-containing protein n=1 Tax=Nibrella viscosa TaxID=1084524 RepID=A0ABP8KRN8_9BACT